MRYFEDIKAGEHYDLGSKIVEKSEMLEYAQKYNRSYLHTNESIMKSSPKDTGQDSGKNNAWKIRRTIGDCSGCTISGI